MHLLNFIADPNYRRHILNQLNRGEGRGRISPKVFHGQRGELRQRYREGQEDQLGALRLLICLSVTVSGRRYRAAGPTMRQAPVPNYAGTHRRA